LVEGADLYQGTASAGPKKRSQERASAPADTGFQRLKPNSQLMRYGTAEESACELNFGFASGIYQRRIPSVRTTQFSPGRSRNRARRFAPLLRELGWAGGVLGQVGN